MPRQHYPKSFAPFSASYSAISFSPLVQSSASMHYVRRLVHDHTDLVLLFNHYLTLCSSIDALKTLLDTLQNKRNEVFDHMTSPNFIRLVQPFLIQQH